MPWCPRCGVGLSQMEMNEGYRTSPTGPSSCAFPLRDRPGENLLVWTTTPWTLTSNVGAAVNPELTYLQGQTGRAGLLRRQGRLHGQAHGGGIQEQGRMGRRRAQAQDARADLQGKEGRLRDRSAKSRARTWSAGPTTAPSTNCRPSSTPAGYPEEIAEVVRQAAMGAGHVRRAMPIASSPGTTSAKRKAPASSTSLPAAARKTSAWARTGGLPPIAPLDEDGVFLPASAR